MIFAWLQYIIDVEYSQSSILLPLFFNQQAELVYTYLSGGGYSVAKAVYAGELLGGEEAYRILFELMSRGLNSLVARLPST